MSTISGRPRVRRPALPSVVALVCAWGLLCGANAALGATPAAKPATHTVIIEGVKYEPEALAVKRGDTVVWVNKDPFPHTVTAADVFDSHSIAAGASWKYVARKAGEYAYTCTLHPNMKGTLKVE
jgi:plastocyanin